MLLAMAAAAASLQKFVEIVGGAIVHATSGTAQAAIEFRTNGEEWQQRGSFAKVGDWLILGQLSDYEIAYNNVTGDAPTGDSTGTWLALTSQRGWYHTRSVIGVTTCTGDMEIRRVVDSVVVESKTVTLRAEVTV